MTTPKPGNESFLLAGGLVGHAFTDAVLFSLGPLDTLAISGLIALAGVGRLFAHAYSTYYG